MHWGVVHPLVGLLEREGKIQKRWRRAQNPKVTTNTGNYSLGGIEDHFKGQRKEL